MARSLDEYKNSIKNIFYPRWLSVSKIRISAQGYLWCIYSGMYEKIRRKKKSIPGGYPYGKYGLPAREWVCGSVWGMAVKGRVKAMMFCPMVVIWRWWWWWWWCWWASSSVDVDFWLNWCDFINAFNTHTHKQTETK